MPSVKILIAPAPVRMSKSYDGLVNTAREVVMQDPMSVDLLVFFNRTRTQVKALYWDRDAGVRAGEGGTARLGEVAEHLIAGPRVRCITKCAAGRSFIGQYP